VNQIVETLYYLTDFIDETIVHEPTLAGAAAFLRDGKSGVWTVEQGAPGRPLAVDGDEVGLDTLELYADRRAVRDADGAWRLEPPAPEACNFFTIRFAPGAGWDSECVSPDFATLTETLSEIGEDEVPDIAVGRHGEARARFELRDTAAELRILQVAAQ